jgi:hypothetical protein
MGAPSRQAIRAKLRQAETQAERAVTRVRGRFAPVGEGWSAPPPDHQATIKADHSMCCAYHEEYAFQPVRSWRL